jgi:hypothetical protein
MEKRRLKRCECGSVYDPALPLHHCPLICRRCRDGACTECDITVDEFVKRLERLPTPSSAINPVHSPSFEQMPATAQLTTFGKLCCVGLVSLIALAALEVATEEWS